MEAPFLEVEGVDQHRTVLEVPEAPWGAAHQVFLDLGLQTVEALLVSGGLEVSWASGLAVECLEEVGFPVDWSIPTVGSIWLEVAGWILLHQCQLLVRLLDALEVPTLMGPGRIVNFVIVLMERGRVCLVSLMCRGLVFGRPAPSLIFPHSKMMEEGSKLGLVLVSLAARAVDEMSDWVGSGVMAGMLRMLVSLLLPSTIARRPMRSYPQRPVSGRRKSQWMVWLPLTMIRSGLILDWELCSSVTVGPRRPCALILWMAARR